ncbi:MAG: hypothetical protein WD425_18405 [Nitrospirales bacterium]
MKAPTVRVPCLFKGQFTFLSLADSQEHLFALCCLTNLTEKDAWFLEGQAQEFEQSGSNFGVLVSTDQVLGSGWVRPLQDFSLRLYIDPISRLRRAFHLSSSLRSTRGETLIFDQDQCLRFRLIHDLNLKGMSAVLDIIHSDFLLAFTEYLIASTEHDHPDFQHTGFNALMVPTS